MEITTTVDINASAPTAWKVFGERFEDISDWADSVVKSSIDRPVCQGAVRTCHIKQVGPVPAGKVTEELTHFDPATHSLTYLVTSGVPGFMRRVENAWTIEPLGDDRCRATSVLSFQVAWWMLPMAPLMKGQMTKTVGGFVKELAVAVEGSGQADGASAGAAAASPA